MNADASTNANYLFGYTYDNIGNFNTSATSETGTAVTSAYTTNNVNQYTAVDTSTNNPAYDDDGNMTTMPVLPGGATAWTLEWNAENRLVKATLGTTVMDFVYDYAGRRVEKKITEDGTVTSREFFVYDGWNLIETLDALNSSAITHKFVWGTDLSGSLQGAGGVGSLLSATDSSGTYYSLYDANGNVGQYLDGSGNIVAAYQYSPFGVIISKSGTKQDDFNFRFSTKFLDNSTGLYYYGFRYYSTRFARWINRDPIGEYGGINLYAMVGNNPIKWTDRLGLEMVFETFEVHGSPEDKMAYMSVDVAYYPEDDDCCDEIKMYQTYQVHDKVNNVYSKGSGTTGKNLDKGWKVDTANDSDYYSDNQVIGTICPIGPSNGSTNRWLWIWDDEARVVDYPGVYPSSVWAYIIDTFLDAIDNERRKKSIEEFKKLHYVYKYKTSAKCVKGKDKGKTYATAEWGFTIKDGKVINPWKKVNNK